MLIAASIAQFHIKCTKNAIREAVTQNTKHIHNQSGDWVSKNSTNHQFMAMRLVVHLIK